jgi:hypothetical protein
MTVLEALLEKRRERKGTVERLVLCKGELFYLPTIANNPEDTVYPVSWATAQAEAKFFGVPISRE